MKLRHHRALQELIATNLDNTGAPTSHRADMAMLAAFSGDWERGCGLLRQELTGTPGHPAVFLFPLVLDAYRRGDYRRALDLAGKFKPTTLFWLPMLKAACHGRRGDTSAAAKQVERLLALRPSFTSLGRRYLSCFLAEDQLVDDILRGLRLAGLEIG